MKAIAKSGMKGMLLAACVALAPATATAEVGDCPPGDPFAPYNRVAQPEGGQPYACTPQTTAPSGAAGRSGPVLESSDAACRDDPFHRLKEVFRAEGPAYQCVAMMDEPAGARGPEGPVMAEDGAGGPEPDPFRGYERSFHGD